MSKSKQIRGQNESREDYDWLKNENGYLKKVNDLQVWRIKQLEKQLDLKEQGLQIIDYRFMYN